MTDTKKTVLSGLLISLGILLPVIFHMIGLGKTFLPMHFPILMAGLFLGPRYGFIVGVITPLLSSLITAMPPFPSSIAMAFELGAYGCFAGYFHFCKNFNIWFSVIASMGISRLVLAVVYGFTFPLLGFKGVPFWYPLTLSVLSSLPGIVCQLAIIPVILIIKNHLYKEGIYE